jgi:hypothetical protein|tara:strand:- start:836 stop:2524 length:1689 start_codon:yes stop_codon:yes gene_type:complete
MAQATQITLDNQTFPSFRSKLNESLSALNTLNSGTSRPSSAVAGTIWLDTTNATNPTLKFFDGTDDISLATIDYSANTVNWLDSSVSLTSPVAITGNSTAGAEIRLPEDTDNGSNYVGLKASDSISSNVTFTLPNADGTDGQAIKTDGSGNLSFGDAGRTGAVNWQTTKKTANFTATSGEGYFCDTSGGAFTLTLPSSPSAGDIVAFKDYAKTFDSNALTISRNSEKIGGSASDSIVSEEGLAVTLVYVDSTQGWLVTESGLQSEVPSPTYISASGGTESNSPCGNFKIHKFTGPGTFTVNSLGNDAGGSDKVDYLVVGGGAEGGGNGGGGGAGGFRESYSAPVSGSYTASPLATPTPLTVTATAFPITVGAGGTGPSGCASLRNGSNSVFSTITSTGGGGGGSSGDSLPSGTRTGASGGSGGGGSAPFPPPGPASGGAGNTPPVSPPQGNNGGGGFHQGCVYYAAGGGGGATAVGNTGGNGTSPAPAGNGGAGATTSISGTPTGYAGGGNGGGCSPLRSPTPVGFGGGGYGSNGTANTGGGGGGNSNLGGSGIVIIRYRFQ